MIGYLESPPQKPVVAGLEECEKIISLDQPEYIPLRTIQSTSGAVISRWTFTAEQREAIAKGADILVAQLCFGGVTPLRIAVGEPTTDELADLLGL